jgi:ABC-type nickel/cobalt efflux system permease component RcnA
VIVLLTGLLAGTLHVWSGPDHLSAIAPLAVQQRRRPWVVGVRWGIGHSTGVAIVGVLALLLREVIPVERLSSIGERLVGVMLIGIGLWGLQKAFRTRLHTHRHIHDGEEHVHAHVHVHGQHEAPQAHVHTHAALGIGIVHGLAGSSHFLGVLPALALPTMVLAVTYVVAFGIGTIISMGVFAALMGALARRPAFDGARAYRGLVASCSVAAMVVGVVWLVAAAH